MSIFYLLVPAAAVAVRALTKTQEPPLPQLAPGVPANEKTIAYRDALLLKQQTEAKAGGMMVAAIYYSVSGEALSESELPPASPGFRWMRTQLQVKMGAKGASLWHYGMGPPPKPVDPAMHAQALKAQTYARLEAHRLAVEGIYRGEPVSRASVAQVFIGTAGSPGNLEEKDYPKATLGFQWTTRRTREQNSPVYAIYSKVGTASALQAQIDSYVRMNACFTRSTMFTSHGTFSVPDEVWNGLKAKGWTEYPPAATGTWAGIFGGGPTLCPPGKKP